MKRIFDEEDLDLVIVAEKALTKPEHSRLTRLEKVIKENFLGFVAVGMALAEINEKRLYRTRDGRTFEEYCLEIWDINVRRGYQLINAALVMENVKNFTQNEMQGVDFITPQNEAQAKELAKLPEKDQGPVWKNLVEQAGEEKSKLTAARIKKAVSEFRGEKVKKAIEQTSSPRDDGQDKTQLMSAEFEEAWEILWQQIEKERQANWRYTSKSVVYKRCEIILEAIRESGLKVSTASGAKA